jgi:Zn-dependent peptidase ImmA (M78 family)
MKKMMLFIAMGLLCSCRKEQIYPEPVNTHIQSFVYDAGRYDVKVKLKKMKVHLVDDLEGDVNGRFSHKENAMYLDTTKTLYKNHLKFLVYHELGHGLLDLRDNDWVDDLGHSASIMNSLPPAWYVKQEYYIEQLFSMAKK